MLNKELKVKLKEKEKELFKLEREISKIKEQIFREEVLLKNYCIYCGDTPFKMVIEEYWDDANFYGGSGEGGTYEVKQFYCKKHLPKEGK